MSGRRSAGGPFLCVLFMLSLLYSTETAWGQVAGPEVEQSLQVSTRVPVVIAFRGASSDLEPLASKVAGIAAVRQKVLSALTPADFTLTHQWEGISAMAGEVSATGLTKLLADPGVLRVDLDVGGGAHLAESVPLIRADTVHARGFSGRGVTVAVLDSGIDTDHPDLRDALIAEQCFCTLADGTGCCPGGSTQRGGTGSAEDDNGHGTNVSGIIVSAGRVAPAGVAFGAKIVAVKVLENNGRFASSSQVISGLNWIIMNRPDVKVVNMSLGTDARFSGTCDSAAAFTMAFAEAVNTLKSRGVVIFASSGNNGDPAQLQAPACVANTVSVGAVYDANVGAVSAFGCTDAITAPGRVTCFSNASSALDLLAPGALITSSGRGGVTSTYRGTSQASPHAAGSAAVLLEAKPTLTPDQIETALKTTGVPLPDTRNGLTFPGINLLAALDAVAGVPMLTLGLSGASFRRGETLTLTATVTPGAAPVTADVYVAVQLPDGSLLFLQGDGSITGNLQPIVRTWTISPFAGPVFAYTFTGGEPGGSYAWLAAFTEPGTLNFIGCIVQAPFSFSP